MSYEESLISITLNADASIGIWTGVHNQPGAANPHYGKQYHGVTVTADNTAGQSTGANGCIGVLQSKPQGTGHAATIAISGVSNVLTGSAVAAGSPVYAAADGKLSATAVGAEPRVGIALAAAASADVLIPVLLTLGN